MIQGAKTHQLLLVQLMKLLLLYYDSISNSFVTDAY